MRPLFFAFGCASLLLAATPVAADERPERLVIATWNLEWFFDHYTGDNFNDVPRQQSAPSRADWDWKLAEVARVIAALKPDILAIQEVENRRSLVLLCSKLKKEYALQYKFAYIEGDDFFTEQDVALLYQGGLTRFSKHEQSKEMHASKEFYNVNKQIVGEFEWGPPEDRERLTIFNAHFRAMTDAAPQRARQAKLVRHWLKEKIGRGENIIVIGDLNSDESFAETTPSSEMGILTGKNTADPADDLLDTLAHLSREQRATHLNGEQYDRILISPSLAEDDPERTDLVFRGVSIRQDLVVRGAEQDKDHMNVFWTIPEEERDVSDHYPLVAEFDFSPRSAGGEEAVIVEPSK
jgi:endonuclease/exonuclease/phosphatase family metal-dependent hydrolase